MTKIKTVLALTIGAAASGTVATAASADSADAESGKAGKGSSAKKQPNVLIIYTDDQGTLDLNCYGAEDLCTPNVDRLAEAGVRFSQFYGAPVSSASRANLLTGQFCLHSGITGNASYDGLPVGKETMAERFGRSGYKTALIGKWHLGESPLSVPNSRGFNYFWGFRGGCLDNYSHYFYWGGPNRHDLWENDTEIYRPGCYLIEEEVKVMKSFISNLEKETSETGQNTPFFIYWGINIPHYPLQPKEEWYDFYAGLKNPRRMYAAFISTMDEYVGEVVEYLKDEGLYDDTIIIFQADNGHSTEDRTFGGGGWAGIYRAGKFSCFEAGIRVPSIISWPGHLPAGECRDQMAMCTDWFPTLVELCGLNSEDMDIDGKNLLPVITDNADSPHDVLHFDFLEQWAVRKGDWKLIYKAVDIKRNNYRKEIPDEYFLSNLKEDPSEQVNFADKYPDIVKDLKAERDRYVESIGK